MTAKEPQQLGFWTFLAENLWGLWIIGFGIVMIVLGIIFPELGSLIVLLFTLFDNSNQRYRPEVNDPGDPTASIVLGSICIVVGVAALMFAWRISRA